VVQRGGAPGGCAGVGWVGNRDDLLYGLRELTKAIAELFHEGRAVTTEFVR